MKDNLKYWVWLQNCLGYANPKINIIRRFYPSIEDFYKGGVKEWKLCGCFTKKEINNLCTNTLHNANIIIEKCNKLGYKMLTPDMEEYPNILKEIYDPPAVLYVNGVLPDVDNTLSIGIVGTRNATNSGKKLAFSISYNLAKSGVSVVSGGALGIDSAAHTGTIMAQGKTICVMGCGLNYNYLTTNAKLRYQISQNGAVISEYQPDIAPQKYSFPQRNRIISALSQGLAVIEAGEKSGALITVNIALNQNKDIFAVPGDVTNTVAYGTNLLIKQGAKPITTANDIIEEYKEKYFMEISETIDTDNISNQIFEKIPSMNKKPISVNKIISTNLESGMNSSNKDKFITNSKNLDNDIKHEKKQLTSVSENAKKIYDIVYENPSAVDDIALKINLSTNKIIQGLTELELEGAVLKKSGGKYFAV